MLRNVHSRSLQLWDVAEEGDDDEQPSVMFNLDRSAGLRRHRDDDRLESLVETQKCRKQDL